MATFLDITGLEYFSVIFTMIFVAVILYAVFQKIDFVKGNKFIHATLAFTIAFLVLISEAAIAVVAVMVPWFSLLFIFILLMLFIFRILGIEEKAISEQAKTSTVVVWVIIISVIILLGAFSTVFGQELLGTNADTPVPINNQTQLSTATDDFGTNVAQTFFHPKVLGLILILTIAALTIKMMAGEKP